MSRIVVPMYVGITEEYYLELLESMEDKGFVSIPFQTSKGMASVQISKIGYELVPI